MDKIKILIAGDPGSIHTSRFVSLLQEIGYNIRVFQSEHQYLQDEHLHNVIIYVSRFFGLPKNGNTLRVTTPFELDFPSGGLPGYPTRLVLGIYRSFFKTNSREVDLAKTILKWKPDIVFSLKMQNDGYTVSNAKKILGADFKTKWVHFNWGTDIEFFGKHPDYADEHLPKIREVLSGCDFHVADCMRDVKQAVDFGFRGRSLGMCLANGGYDLSVLSKVRKNAAPKRDVILVKGRQGGFVGKAFNILEALHRIPQVANQYKIKIILANPDTKGAAMILSRIDGIQYEVLSQLPYQELLALYATSRMAISASDVDGTPSFLTEAMVMGALPIHSDMDSVREWIADGKNGLLFPVDDIAALASCIERAHIDEQLIESARAINWEIANARMDRNKIRLDIAKLIETVQNSNY